MHLLVAERFQKKPRIMLGPKHTRKTNDHQRPFLPAARQRSDPNLIEVRVQLSQLGSPCRSNAVHGARDETAVAVRLLMVTLPDRHTRKLKER
ncbi:hypothetical protein HYG77_37860 (plasmid) [Rhodococcus sp. ZPP]|uniref:hypothetical protein n=1 Tax=Rhodococcus sp. ZPP TaxID=2749906 RepID=UPI001AD85F8F|nr:hypothetical protein [Rhodococcus sp. ZPP]QTJ71026.1 hypothetical protein HYG77_37860 [Rhodococcus sp. ZPP]